VGRTTLTPKRGAGGAASKKKNCLWIAGRAAHERPKGRDPEKKTPSLVKGSKKK